MSEYLAPNGKPSKLTPEQYKLVRTPEFKEWFGDWENDPANASKVVDENGEPLVCRHYSQKPIRFNEFTKQKPNDTINFISFAKEGYYFSSTDKKSIEKIYNRSKKGLLYEVFLNVKNILDLGKYNAYDFTTKKAVNWKEFTFEMLQKYVIKGRIGSFDDYTEYNENVNAFWMDEIDEKAKNQILKLGYNGVWGDRDKYADSITDEFYGTDQIVVFEPTQIKLADGTNTTFDANNPDIRFDDGGNIYEDEKSLKIIIQNVNKENKYKGAYKRIFEILEESIVFYNPYGTIYEELKGTDFEIEITPMPENNKIEQIKKLPNVQIVDSFETGGEIRLSVNKIENQQVSKFLSRNTQHNGQFVAKNGKLFYITFDLRQNTCKVYNAELFVEAFKNGYFTGNEEVAVAVFSIDYENKTFSGYSENQSIQVKEEYRRIGIATAITDFVEDVLKMKYKPSKLLSKEMQGFVENRFKFLKGVRTLAQTPAPKKERIYGSEKNKPESSKDTKSAKKIKFSEKTLETIKNKVAEHNEKHPSKKVNLASAKAVVRRGMGAYSSTHRPTISGGKPNSRVAWGLARLNAFFYKIINGKSKSGKYNQDDDLINELGYKVKKYSDGGEISINMRNEIIDILSKNARYGKQILSVQEVGNEVIQSCIESNTYFGNTIRQANENYIMIPVSYEDKLWAVDKKVGYIYFAKPNENTKIRVEYKYDMQDYPVPILFDSEIKNNQEFYDVNDYDEIKSSKFDSEFLYRGINNDEMLSIIENGFIKSNAFLNIGKQQEETTSFAQHISQASAYAVGFNAWFDEVTFAKPKYILKVKKEGVNYKPTIETDIENEVDVFGEIPIQQIESIYEFRLGECQMGQVEINVGYNNDFSDGSRSPMFKKVFVRKTDINSIIERNKIQKSDGGDIQAYEESMGISEFDEGGESGGDVNYKNQPRDLSQIENYENIYKGAEFYSFSDSSEKQEKSDRWFELFRINQKERQLTTSEFIEFMQLSNELSWEEFADGGQIEIPSEFWGNEAGGVLIYCRKTKRYLLLERSKYVNEPNTWNLISGKIEEYESVKEAVIRECFEEIGFHISDLIPIYEYETNDFIFHNFLSVVDDEFHVDFNWESSDYGWFNLKDFPKKLHFGLKILLESVNLIDIVNSNKEYYQRRNIGGGLEYYKRKGIEHWVFTTKEDFEKNAQEDNTIEF